MNEISGAVDDSDDQDIPVGAVVKDDMPGAIKTPDRRIDPRIQPPDAGIGADGRKAVFESGGVKTGLRRAEMNQAIKMYFGNIAGGLPGQPETVH